jgi:hypothetical protein
LFPRGYRGIMDTEDIVKQKIKIVLALANTLKSIGYECGEISFIEKPTMQISNLDFLNIRIQAKIEENMIGGRDGD